MISTTGKKLVNLKGLPNMPNMFSNLLIINEMLKCSANTTDELAIAE